MRLFRCVILILSLFVLMIPVYAQDDEQLTWEEQRAIQQQENWDEALRRIAEAAEINAIELDLSHLRLKELPSQFYELTQLESINLDGNCIGNWSSEIGNLVNLTIPSPK